LSGKRRKKFTEDQKQFAVTLHYYSPAAYQYVRRRFKLLPCPRTIRGWLRSFDGSPGLTQQSFDTIAGKTAAASEEAWSYKLCALHVDEMEIKKHIEIQGSYRSGKTGKSQGILCGQGKSGKGQGKIYFWKSQGKVREKIKMK